MSCRISRPPFAAAFAVFVALAGIVGFADEPPAPPKMVSLDLEDVTVGDYLEFINESLPTNQRAICTKAVENVTLPRINGLKCRADVAVRLLEPITANSLQPLKVTLVGSDDGLPPLPIVDAANAQAQPVAVAVNVRSALSAFAPAAESGDAPPQVDDEDVRSKAIRALVETLEEGLRATFPEQPQPVSMKYHHLSGLLFVRGTEQQAEFVREVVSELKNQ